MLKYKQSTKNKKMPRSLAKAIEQSRTDTAMYLTGNGQEDWGIYDSGLKSYEFGFSSVLKGRTIESIARGKENPLIIDLMASTAMLEQLFSEMGDIPGKKGIAVTLRDMRSDKQRELDKKLGIEQFSGAFGDVDAEGDAVPTFGDLTTSAAWRNLRRQTLVRKADIIIEKAEQGVNVLPNDPMYYHYCVGTSWRMLNPNQGDLLLQFPNEDFTGLLGNVGISVDRWIAQLNDQGIEATADTGSMSVLALHRTPQSPDRLPAPF